MIKRTYVEGNDEDKRMSREFNRDLLDKKEEPKEEVDELDDLEIKEEVDTKLRDYDEFYSELDLFESAISNEDWEELEYKIDNLIVILQDMKREVVDKNVSREG
jgi:hypothetical protein